jgi:hypothetical protein
MSSDNISIEVNDDINNDLENENNKIDNENDIINDLKNENNKIDNENDIINDLKNEINKIDNENDIINDNNDVDIYKPAYIDKPIIEVSPNGTYLVMYNPKNHLIVGWNAKDIEEGQLTKSDIPVKIEDDIIYMDQISVSDDKKLAYTTYNDNYYCRGTNFLIIQLCI